MVLGECLELDAQRRRVVLGSLGDRFLLGSFVPGSFQGPTIGYHKLLK